MKRLLRTRAPHGALTTVLLAGAFCCHSIGFASHAHAQEAPPPSGSPSTAPTPAAPGGPSADPSASPSTPPDAAASPETPSTDDAQAEATAEASSTEVGQGSGLFEASLSGGEAAAGEGEAAAAPPAVSFNGYTRGDVYIGKEAGESNGEIKAAYGELALQVRTPKETYGDGFAEARLRYGLEGERKQLFVDLREAYVNAHAGPFDLRLGQQVIVWGRADAFNPTNNITPSDLRVRSPVEDDRRVGNVGARAFLNFQPFRLEGVYMPFYVPSELPVELPWYIGFGEPRRPSAEFRNGLGGARLHLELPAVETSISYVYGHAPLPGYRYEGFTVGPGAQITIIRQAYNHHVAGFDFSTALGDVLAIRGEAAYRRPLHYEGRAYAPRPDLQYVLGADRTFGSVNVIAQYMGRYVFDWKREPGAPAGGPLGPEDLPDVAPDRADDIAEQVRNIVEPELRQTNQMIFSQLEELQHLATVRFEWLTLHDTLSLSLLGMMNFSTEEWLLAPKMAYRMTDNLTASVGGEILAGPTGTLFGTIDEQLSAGYAELRVSY